MKKFINYLLLVLIVIPLVFLFAACKNKNPQNNIGVGKLTTNLLNFETIGIGYINNSASNVNFTNNCSHVSMNVSDNNKHHGKLVGIDEHGNQSQIEYKEDGKKTNKFQNLIACNSTERFMFVRYSDDYIPEVIDTTCLQFNGDNTYVIDKNTGNMYKVEIHFNLLLSYFGITASDCGDYCIIESQNTYYKMSVENDNLKFTEILTRDKLPGGCDIRLADKYGNCLITTGYNKSYILTNQNTLKEAVFKVPSGVVLLDSSYAIRAYNGIIYSNGYYLNESGDFILAENTPNLTVLPKEYLVYAENNTEYYFSKLDFNTSTGVYYPYTQKIMKKTINENGIVEISSISLDFTGVSYSNIYLNAPYIYTLNTDSVISKISILTGEKTNITIPNVIITSIEPIGFGKLLFKGTNLSLQNISGIVDDLGDISYSIKDSEFKVFYYRPLNNKKL